MKPIVILTGPNEAFKRDFLSRNLKNFSKEEITVYYADETGFDEIFSQCGQDSLFSSNNIVVVKNLDVLSEKSRNDFEDRLNNYMDHLNPAASLWILTPEVNPDIISRVRAIGGETVEFKKLYKNELIRYIREKLAENSIEFEDEIPDFIVSMANEDSEEADLLLNMLITFSRNSKKVAIEDARKLLARTPNMDIFDLIEGIFMRDLKKALNAMSDLRLTGEPLTRLNSMLLRTARHLWGYFAVRDKSKLVQILKIKPFEVKMLGTYAGFVDMKFVSAVFELVKKIELKIKSMHEDFAYLELENFIIVNGRGHANV